MSTTTTTGTLTAGSSKTFNLAPGSALSLTLSPNVRVTITETPETVSGSGVGGNTTRVHEPQLPGTFAYGPYAMGGVVVVAVASNSGSSVAWTRKDTVVTTDSTGTSLVSGAGNATPLQTPTGNVIEVIGMGDSMSAANSGNVTASAASRSNNVVTLTATGHAAATGEVCRVFNMLDTSYNTNSVVITRVDADTVTYPSIGPNGSTVRLSSTKDMILQRKTIQNDNSYMFWLNAKTKGAFRLALNAGCNGQTSVDMLARFATDVVGNNTARCVIIWAGYNDFPIAGLTAAQVYANVVAMAAQCVGKIVVIVSAIPWTTGGATANRVEAAKYNRMIRAYCNSTSNVRYADAAKYLVDATNATRFSPLSGMLRSDGIHITPKAAERVAQAIIEAMNGLIPLPSRLVSSNADQYGYDPQNPNIVDNMPTTNSGGATAGGASGTVTTGWGVTLTNTSTTATAVASCPARSDGIAYDQQVVFTSGGSSDSVMVSSQGYITGRHAIGDTLVMLAEMTVSGLSGANIKAIECYITFNGSTPSTQGMISKTQAENAAAFLQTDGTYTLVSPECVVPLGATNIGFNFNIIAGAAGTAVTVKFGRLSIEKI